MRPTVGYPCYFSSNRCHAIGLGFWFNVTSGSAVCYFTTTFVVFRKEAPMGPGQHLLASSVPAL